MSAQGTRPLICGFEEAEGATLGFSSSGGRACLIAHLGSDPEHQEKLQAQWLGRQILGAPRSCRKFVQRACPS